MEWYFRGTKALESVTNQRKRFSKVAKLANRAIENGIFIKSDEKRNRLASTPQNYACDARVFVQRIVHRTI
jgi:hypothetical protein